MGTSERKISNSDKCKCAYSPEDNRMIMYNVEPTKRMTAVACLYQLCYDRRFGQHLRARPVMEKRMKAM